MPVTLRMRKMFSSAEVTLEAHITAKKPAMPRRGMSSSTSAMRSTESQRLKRKVATSSPRPLRMESPMASRYIPGSTGASTSR